MRSFVSEKTVALFFDSFTVLPLNLLDLRLSIIQKLTPHVPSCFMSRLFSSLRRGIRAAPLHQQGIFASLLEQSELLFSFKRDEALQMLGLIVRRCILEGDSPVIRRQGVKVIEKELRLKRMSSFDVETMLVKHDVFDTVKIAREGSGGSQPLSPSGSTSTTPSASRKNSDALSHLSPGSVTLHSLEALAVIFDFLPGTSVVAEKVVFLLAPLCEKESAARYVLNQFILRKDLSESVLIRAFESLSRVLPLPACAVTAANLITASEAVVNVSSLSSALTAFSSFPPIARVKLFGSSKSIGSVPVCRAVLVFLLRAVWAQDTRLTANSMNDLESTVVQLLVSASGKSLVGQIAAGWIGMIRRGIEGTTGSISANSLPNVDESDFNPPKVLPQVFHFLSQIVLGESAGPRALRRSKRVKLLMAWQEQFDFLTVFVHELRDVLMSLRENPTKVLDLEQSIDMSSEVCANAVRALLFPRLKFLTICLTTTEKLHLTPEHLISLQLQSPLYSDLPQSYVERIADDLLWQWLTCLVVPPGVHEVVSFTSNCHANGNTLSVPLLKDAVDFKPSFQGLSDAALMTLVDVLSQCAWNIDTNLSLAAYSCALVVFLVHQNDADSPYILSREDGAEGAGMSLQEWAAKDGLSLFSFPFISNFSSSSSNSSGAMRTAKRCIRLPPPIFFSGVKCWQPVGLSLLFGAAVRSVMEEVSAHARTTLVNFYMCCAETSSSSDKVDPISGPEWLSEGKVIYYTPPGSSVQRQCVVRAGPASICNKGMRTSKRGPARFVRLVSTERDSADVFIDLGTLHLHDGQGRIGHSVKPTISLSRVSGSSIGSSMPNLKAEDEVHEHSRRSKSGKSKESQVEDVFLSCCLTLFQRAAAARLASPSSSNKERERELHRNCASRQVERVGRMLQRYLRAAHSKFGVAWRPHAYTIKSRARLSARVHFIDLKENVKSLLSAAAERQDMPSSSTKIDGLNDELDAEATFSTCVGRKNAEFNMHIYSSIRDVQVKTANYLHSIGVPSVLPEHVQLSALRRFDVYRPGDLLCDICGNSIGNSNGNQVLSFSCDLQVKSGSQGSTGITHTLDVSKESKAQQLWVETLLHDQLLPKMLWGFLSMPGLSDAAVGAVWDLLSYLPTLEQCQKEVRDVISRSQSLFNTSNFWRQLYLIQVVQGFVSPPRTPVIGSTAGERMSLVKEFLEEGPFLHGFLQFLCRTKESDVWQRSIVRKHCLAWFIPLLQSLCPKLNGHDTDSDDEIPRSNFRLRSCSVTQMTMNQASSPSPMIQTNEPGGSYLKLFGLDDSSASNSSCQHQEDLDEISVASSPVPAVAEVDWLQACFVCAEMLNEGVSFDSLGASSSNSGVKQEVCLRIGSGLPPEHQNDGALYSLGMVVLSRIYQSLRPDDKKSFLTMWGRNFASLWLKWILQGATENFQQKLSRTILLFYQNVAPSIQIEILSDAIKMALNYNSEAVLPQQFLCLIGELLAGSLSRAADGSLSDRASELLRDMAIAALSLTDPKPRWPMKYCSMCARVVLSACTATHGKTASNCLVSFDRNGGNSSSSHHNHRRDSYEQSTSHNKDSHSQDLHNEDSEDIVHPARPARNPNSSQKQLADKDNPLILSRDMKNASWFVRQLAEFLMPPADTSRAHVQLPAADEVVYCDLLLIAIRYDKLSARAEVAQYAVHWFQYCSQHQHLYSAPASSTGTALAPLAPSGSGLGGRQVSHPVDSGGSKARVAPSGLHNLGGTCYANSIIQLLFAIRELRVAMTNISGAPFSFSNSSSGSMTNGTSSMHGLQYEKDLNKICLEHENKKTKIANHRLVLELEQVFCSLSSTSSSAHTPKRFLDSCSILPLQYPVYSQNDAAEFYDGVVNALAEFTAGNLGEDVKSLLQGTRRRLKQCHKCRKCFSLAKEKFFKLELSAVDESGRPFRSLEHCMDYAFQPEVIRGDNRTECDYCKEKTDSTIITEVEAPPPYLVIQLKRFSFDLESLAQNKLHHDILFEEQWQVHKWCVQSSHASSSRQDKSSTNSSSHNGIHPSSEIISMNEEVDEDTFYDLHSVVVHSGGFRGGHYYAFVRTDLGSWVRLDDQAVRNQPDFYPDTCQAECFGGKSRGKQLNGASTCAYLLLYKRRQPGVPPPGQMLPRGVSGEFSQEGLSRALSRSRSAPAKAVLEVPAQLEVPLQSFWVSLIDEGWSDLSLNPDNGTDLERRTSIASLLYMHIILVREIVGQGMLGVGWIERAESLLIMIARIEADLNWKVEVITNVLEVMLQKDYWLPNLFKGNDEAEMNTCISFVITLIKALVHFADLAKSDNQNTINSSSKKHHQVEQFVHISLTKFIANLYQEHVIPSIWTPEVSYFDVRARIVCFFMGFLDRSDVRSLLAAKTNLLGNLLHVT